LTAGIANPAHSSFPIRCEPLLDAGIPVPRRGGATSWSATTRSSDPSAFAGLDALERDDRGHERDGER